MKNKKLLFLAALSSFAVCALSGCNKAPADNGTDDIKPLEIGDSKKKWSSAEDYDELPIIMEKNKGRGSIIDDFGNEDDSSLYFELTKNSYIGSNLVTNPYFLEDDAKNGDIISLWYYLPEDCNIKTLKFEVVTSQTYNAQTISDLQITVNEGYVGEWKKSSIIYNTLDTLGSLKLTYTLADTTQVGKIYIDDIDITLGAEVVKTDYEYNDESLCESYKDFFKVGTCMSSNMMRNTEIRKITKHNFNSITAENEGKPEQILDQKECQKLAKQDETAVAITVAPFEKIYDWAEANHIGVRHHTFVWYSQTPDWFFNKGYAQNGQKANKETMLKRMENFIKVTLETINERWPGLVYAVDVANEAVENGGIRSNNNNWYTTVGSDFVYYAFKYASQYKAEGQELYYNDFAFDYNPSACTFALNNILKKAIQEKLIDGVGIQGHLDSNANWDNVINDAKQIKQKGLKCQITELDITIQANNKQNLTQQSKAYETLVKKVIDNNIAGTTDINAFVLWGINDNASWKSSQYPLLFTDNYGKKPAYYGLLNAVKDYLPEENEEDL